MKVDPSLAVIVDPSPPVIATADFGEPPPLEVGAADAVGFCGELEGCAEVDLWFLGLMTVNTIGKMTASTTIIKPSSARTTKSQVRRLALGARACSGIGSSWAYSSLLLAKSIPESFGVACMKESRGDSVIPGFSWAM